MGVRRGVGTCTAVAVLLGAFFAWVLTAPLGHEVILIVDNGGQLGASVAAAAACLWASRRGDPARRRAWRLLGVGVGCWAAGQAVWSFYEVVLGEEAPFPSWADVGFLLFPVIAAAGLAAWLTAGARARDIMDGAIIAASLLVLSWGTTLGSVYAAGTDDRLSFALSLTYPVGDLVMATLVLFTLARSQSHQRGVLLAVAAGLGGLAVADSAYVYLITVEAYASGNLISSGWVVGFLLIAAGAASSDTATTSMAARKGDHAAPAPIAKSRVSMLLPYAPMVVAEGLVIYQLTQLSEVPVVSVGLGFGLVALVLARQWLALNENRRLLTELGATRDRLHHLALHDGLTGLANRTLFTDRVEHALSVRQSPERCVAVLFCDLDDFKIVNDGLGHEAGDTILCRVADRLRDALRSGDTIARLGGDEFAVLLEDPSDAHTVAARLVEEVGRPCDLDGEIVQVSISVGLALSRDLSGEDGATMNADCSPSEQARRLLRAADGAMYGAKGAGKGRAVHAGPPVPTGAATSIPTARLARDHAGTAAGTA
jgi:diguanylate cyclase (GGDEF)-like protein